MEKRRLGNSDLDITRIGFGAWAIGGGGWQFGWGPQDDKESIAAIHAGLEKGLNWIDTAAIYGLGHSEEMVAEALKGVTNKPYVFTKCSMIWNDKGEISRSLKADSLKAEVEASLKRLKVETIDLYQVHWPNPAEDIEEGWRTLADLQQQGKLRWIGVSNFDKPQMQRAEAIAPITSLQPPYSLLARGVEEEILPYAQEKNIGVIVYSPMASGLLSGKMTRERIEGLADDDWRKKNPKFTEPALSKNLALADLLREIGAEHDRSAGEVAIAWTLKNPAVTAAIVGFRRPDQLDGMMRAADLVLNHDEVEQIERFMV